LSMVNIHSSDLAASQIGINGTTVEEFSVALAISHKGTKGK